MEELTRYLKALVLLELEGQRDEAVRRKPELLLANAGFTASEVAEMLGKTKAAAAKAISRAKKADAEQGG